MGLFRCCCGARFAVILAAWGGLLGLAGSVEPALAQVIDPSHHPWAKFAPGSWKVMRTTSETFDQGKERLAHTVTHTRTELVSRDEHSYTLRVSSEVAVMGKRLAGKHRTLRRRFDDVPFAYHVSYQQKGTKTIRVSEKVFSCRVYEGKATGPEGNLQVKLWYCPQQSPYVLFRQMVLTGPQNQVLEETTWTVVAVDMPYLALQRLVSTVHYKVVQRKPSGTIVRLVVSSEEVPGGVVFESSKELDPQGNLRHRSTQELVVYGIFRAAVSDRGRNYYGSAVPYDEPRFSPRSWRRLRRKLHFSGSFRTWAIRP